MIDKIEAAMRQMDCHAMVRYDPERKENRFTIVVRGIRVGDTDSPVQLLEKSASAEWCYHPEVWVPGRPPAIMNVCACGMNATCPDCGFGWGAAPCECEELSDD